MRFGTFTLMYVAAMMHMEAPSKARFVRFVRFGMDSLVGGG